MRSPTKTMLLLAAILLASGAQAQEELAPSDVPSNLAPSADSDVVAAGIFARMDSNRDGQVSLEEFETGLARPFGSQKEGVVYQKLPARFRVLDTDGDSFLDAKEYAGLAQHWQGHGATPPPLAQADRNHDGRIDFREFAFIHAPSDEDSRTGDETRSAEDTPPASSEDSSTAPTSAPRRSPGMRARPGSGLRRVG